MLWEEQRRTLWAQSRLASLLLLLWQDGSDEYVSDVHCLDLETFVWSRCSLPAQLA